FAFERGAANRVDRLALLVHHVVVFEQMFAGVEVLGFHGFLRTLNAIGNHFRFDRHAFGHTEAIHELLDALAAEDAHEVVFKREEKARRTRIALTTSAAAKLIIDAASFMAFGAEDVQAAERNDFIVLGFALIGEVIVSRLPLIDGNLKDFALVLKEDH